MMNAKAEKVRLEAERADLCVTEHLTPDCSNKKVLTIQDGGADEQFRMFWTI